jgi:small subunit ribosomal protein S5
VLLKPASAGTGVIAAGGVRAVLEVAGVRDILTKSMGSANVLNVVMATFAALDQLKSPQVEAARRGKRVEDLLPFWERRKQNA